MLLQIVVKGGLNMKNKNEVKIDLKDYAGFKGGEEGEEVELSIDTTGLDVRDEEAEWFLRHIAETLFGGIVNNGEE